VSSSCSQLRCTRGAQVSGYLVPSDARKGGVHEVGSCASGCVHEGGAMVMPTCTLRVRTRGVNLYISNGTFGAADVQLG
jgi:hypothetical protein